MPSFRANQRQQLSWWLSAGWRYTLPEGPHTWLLDPEFWRKDVLGKDEVVLASCADGVFWLYVREINAEGLPLLDYIHSGAPVAAPAEASSSSVSVGALSPEPAPRPREGGKFAKRAA